MQEFLLQCKLSFHAHVGMDEATLLTHFMNFLTGNALSWATAFWLGENNITNYVQFALLFQCVFDHSSDGKEVSDEPLLLRKGIHLNLTAMIDSENKISVDITHQLQLPACRLETTAHIRRGRSTHQEVHCHSLYATPYTLDQLAS